MASAPSTPQLPRHRPALPSPSPSLQGLEQVIRDPQLSPRTRPSLSSRKSSSSDVNKPLPPSPPPPLFSPQSSRSRGSPRSQSSGTSSHRTPAPRSISLRPPRPSSTASATPTTIIELYSQAPDHPPVPRVGTPLLAPHARVSLAPTMQEERLHAFEVFATSPDSEYAEQYPQPGMQPRPSITDSEYSQPSTLPYTFNSTENIPTLHVTQEPPPWAPDASMTAEDVAARYRLTLLPSPFASVDQLNEFENGEQTPTHPVLPPLARHSPFQLAHEDDEVDESDVLTPTLPSSQFPLSPLPLPYSPPARHSYATSHEESYRASRLSSPAPDAAHPMYLPSPPLSQSTPSHHSLSSWEAGASTSQASWERGDDVGLMQAQIDDAVSPIDDEETQRRLSSDPRSRATRPSLNTYEVFQQAQSARSSRALSPSHAGHSQIRIGGKSPQPQSHKAHVPKPLSLIAADRKSTYQIRTPGGGRSARSSVGHSVGGQTDASYEDDSPYETAYLHPHGAPESHFSDDSDGDGKHRRRSNPLTHLRKALGHGHRKTPSAASSAVSSPSMVSSRAGNAEEKTAVTAPVSAPPVSPKQPPKTSPKRPQHKRGGSSLGKLGVKFDDHIGDMYETLQRFSLEGGKLKEKEKEEKNRKSGLSNEATSPGSPGSAKNRKSKEIIKKLRKREYSGLVRLPTSPSTPGSGTSSTPRTPASPPLVTKYASGSTWETVGVEQPADDDDDEKSEGWLARRRRKKEEAKREEWREAMKGKIKIVQSEPQGMMAIVATRNSMEGGML